MRDLERFLGFLLFDLWMEFFVSRWGVAMKKEGEWKEKDGRVTEVNLESKAPGLKTGRV